MTTDRTGQKVPQVTFKLREGDDWRETTTDELFGGKSVVVFALPGAFTPTCSSSHLPRYEELFARLREEGVDDVICLSVNDAFVMDAWGRDQGASHVRLVADGNGDFSRGMGMLVDKRDLGFGDRSWRYSMLVRDGVIESMVAIEGAAEILGGWAARGDRVEIVTGRPPATIPATRRWLEREGMPHAALASVATEAVAETVATVEDPELQAALDRLGRAIHARAGAKDGR